MLALFQGLIALTWPLDCPSCGVPVAVIGFCADCAAHVRPRDPPRCTCCDADVGVSGPPRLCGRCLQTPPAFANAWAPFDYAGPMGDAIRAGKYAGRADAFAAVRRVMLGAMPEPLVRAPPGVVVPVPLHPRRVKARGFQPTLLLARTAARALGAPCRSRLVSRSRDTPPQAGRGERGRRENVRGAFTVRGNVQGADVLVVDDVLTTGATVREVARALRRAGAARSRVLAVAAVARGP